MSLPHFIIYSKRKRKILSLLEEIRYNKNPWKRNRKINDITKDINDNLIKKKYIELYKRFNIGDKIYYKSKYGGCLIMIIKELNVRIHDGKCIGYIKTEGNNHSYETDYCFSIIEIRRNKLERLN